MSDNEQEQRPNSVVHDDKARKLKYWGIGLAILGFVIEPMAAAKPFLPFLPIVLLVGMGMCGVGVAAYAKAHGNSVAWGLFGLVPVFGLFLFMLFFLLKTGFRKNWVGGLLALVVLGVLTAIAIPNFLNYAPKTRTAEAKVGLHGLFTTATFMKEKRKTFVISDIKQLDYEPAGTPRYTFWYSVNGIPTRINVVGPDHARGCDGPPTTVNVAASATGFTAAAKGNIDNDATCDEWSINDERILKHTLDDTPGKD